MKKRILFALIICSALSLFAASKNKIITVQGSITSYGNIPFNFPGIKTTEDKLYGIIADPEIKQALLDNQGKKIEIKGYIHATEKDELFIESLDDGYIEVEDWKVIE